MLSILGVVAIVAIAIQVYKSASGTGRNAGLWTSAAVGIGVAVQFIFPFIMGVLLVVGLLFAGTPAQKVQEKLEAGLFGLLTVIDLVGVILGIVGMFLIARHVSKVKDDDFPAPPPPPPTFG